MQTLPLAKMELLSGSHFMQTHQGSALAVSCQLPGDSPLPVFHMDISQQGSSFTFDSQV